MQLRLCSTAMRNGLSVLPSIRLGHIRCQGIEAKARITESDALEVGIDLQRAFLGVALDGASKKSTFSRKSAEAFALCECPATGDGTLWDAG